MHLFALKIWKLKKEEILSNYWDCNEFTFTIKIILHCDNSSHTLYAVNKYK